MHENAVDEVTNCEISETPDGSHVETRISQSKL